MHRPNVMLMSLHVATVSMQVRRFDCEGLCQLQLFCNVAKTFAVETSYTCIVATVRMCKLINITLVTR